MKLRSRLLALLLTVILALTCSASAVDLDLTTMTRQELEALRDQITVEIETNHTPSSSEKDAVLNLVKEWVDSEFASHGASVTWPWLDYTYSRDWNRYSVKTTITYTQGSSSAEAELYAEAEKDGDAYRLILVRVGDEELLNEEPTPTATPKPAKKAEPTATPKPTKNSSSSATATPKPTKRAARATRTPGSRAATTPKATATPKPTKRAARATRTPGSRTAATPKPTATPKRRDGYGIGETCVYEGVRYTLTGYRESYGSSWNSPDSGCVFVLLSFTIENDSSEDLSLSTLLYFDAYCDDYSVDYDFGQAEDGIRMSQCDSRGKQKATR